MASYVAMEPPLARPGERTVIVPDRLAWLALVAPVIWLLWHRLWIEALAVLAASFALAALAAVPGMEGLAVALGFLLSLLIALEGNALRLAALRRRGWHEAAIVDAASRGEAELRYLSGLEPGSPGAAAPRAPVSAAPARGDMLGMLDYPGTGG